MSLRTSLSCEYQIDLIDSRFLRENGLVDFHHHYSCVRALEDFFEKCVTSVTIGITSPVDVWGGGENRLKMPRWKKFFRTSQQKV